VGVKSQGQKRTNHPEHCLWCDHIQVGDAWIQERRASNDGLYSDGICPDCKPDYFLDSLNVGG
jgi:hypothetical protein